MILHAASVIQLKFKSFHAPFPPMYMDIFVCPWKPYFRIERRILVAEKDNRTTPVNVEADSAAEFQNGIYENADTSSAKAMNESGIDYMWGSDQDDLIKEQEKEE
jgi:hypothetical protein